MSERILDLIGLKCPLPVLMVRRMLGDMEEGDILVAACTDPLARIDIPHLVREAGHLLEAEEVGPDRVVFRIRKGGGSVSRRPETAG